METTDVDGHKMDFGVTVLTSLGRGHFDDLAGTAYKTIRTPATRYLQIMNTLDDDVPVLAKGRALHGERQGGPSAGLGGLQDH